MSNPILTKDADFQRLLPWAKALARAQGHPQLNVAHFVQAAYLLVQKGQWKGLPPTLVAALDAAVAGTSLPDVAEGVSEAMSVAAELKVALVSASSVQAWLAQLLGAQTVGTQGQPAIPNAEAETDAVLQGLLPWLHGAMRHNNETELTTRAMAHGILAALATPALDAYADFKHLCQGHADELLFWLEQQSAYSKMVEPVSDAESVIKLAPSMQAVLSDVVHPNEHAPTPVWRWLHAAVAEANQHARLLQVAYHEAGHAVAIHVLEPEMTLRTATIVPKGDSSGHVSPDMNNQLSAVYMNSLEYLKEQVVVFLAGRAVEQKRFGLLRADSGAVSDIQSATTLAWRGITVFGLDEVFGPVSLKAAQSVVAQAKDSSYLADMAPTGWLHDLAQQRLHTWMKWGMQEARRLVDAHWEQIDRLALALFERKTMSNAEVRRVLGGGGPEFGLADIPAQHPAAHH